ncbi:MAG: hypothetical protein Q7J80_13685, partial [Anaerolineales bacterium]|nr:hypothetical protein [Anaerolineales bacterium]
ILFLIHVEYSHHMSELLKRTADINQPRGLTLILTQDRALKSKTDLIAALILRGPLFVLSADEWLPSFALPTLIFAHTIQVKETMRGLRTVRASTCYRLLDSLSSVPARGEPMLVLDFLHTFYDPDIRLASRLMTLRGCCHHLKRIAFYRPVILMAQEMRVADYDKFLPILLSIAEKTLYLEPDHERVAQPALF